METLFRFVLQRPPSKPKDWLVIPLAQNTNFQEELMVARQSNNPLNAMREEAHQFAATKNFANSLDGLTIGAGLRR